MLGLTIVKGMKRNGNKYDDGSILDPRDGTVYHAQMERARTVGTRGARLSRHSVSWPDADLDPPAGRRNGAGRHSRGNPSHRRRRRSEAASLSPRMRRRLRYPKEFDRPPASHSKFDGLTGNRVLVSRDRPEREKLRVAVVAQIEDPGKTGRGVAFLVPKAVRSLGRQGETHATRDARSPFAPPPSARAAPRRSAKPCSARARSHDNRVCSSRHPRPNRRPGSGWRRANRRLAPFPARSRSSPAMLSAQSADQVP